MAAAGADAVGAHRSVEAAVAELIFWPVDAACAVGHAVASAAFDGAGGDGVGRVWWSAAVGSIVPSVMIRARRGRTDLLSSTTLGRAVCRDAVFASRASVAVTVTRSRGRSRRCRRGRRSSAGRRVRGVGERAGRPGAATVDAAFGQRGMRSVLLCIPRAAMSSARRQV